MVGFFDPVKSAVSQVVSKESVKEKTKERQRKDNGKTMADLGGESIGR